MMRSVCGQQIGDAIIHWISFLAFAAVQRPCDDLISILSGHGKGQVALAYRATEDVHEFPFQAVTLQ
jgi:hypothetical protein